MAKKRYRGEQKSNLLSIQNVPREVVEKHFIMDFLAGIPLDDLKKLVGFDQLDPSDREKWIGNPDIPERLYELRTQGVVLYEAELIIGEDEDKSLYSNSTLSNIIE
jgi:hypothetical protein